MMPALTSQETKQLLAFQTNEITEHHIYHQLSLLQKKENNRRILTELAAEESGHYQLLKTYTQKEVGPKKGKVRFYVWIARLFGLTFSIKLMENSEKYAHLTSSLRTPKFFVKEFSYFLMPCHQHGLRINLLVQR